MDLIVLFVVDRKNSGLATHGIHPLRPVSYTHLDVYKRQPFVVFRCKGHIADVAACCLLVVLEPVSYTHLDVYKRQILRGWPITGPYLKSARNTALKFL